MLKTKRPRSQPSTGLWANLPLSDVESLLLPKGYKLLPLIRQKYELELAAAEAKVLSPRELVERGAYFMSIGGELTNHYHIAQAAPLQVSPTASETRKKFFEANRYAVAYATHGLFPYRGKFHPQMIKAIINIIGVKPGNVILDPMVGSGTTLVEAAIMGIHCVGIELNPFTVFMSQVKLQALEMDTHPFASLVKEADSVFRFFEGEKVDGHFLDLFTYNQNLKALALLSYLDTLGYARRTKANTARGLFPGLLKRYCEAVEAFNRVRIELGLKLGKWIVIYGDARHMPLEGESIDGIIFSPPYSFALDYVENDRVQLEYLGIDATRLKKHMVGLRRDGEAPSGRWKSIERQVDLYYRDMLQIFQEAIGS